MLGYFVYRGTDDKPDFFMGWRWSEDQQKFVAVWVSERVLDQQCVVQLYPSLEVAKKAGRELKEKTTDKRVEVMQVLGGPIWFDL